MTIVMKVLESKAVCAGIIAFGLIKSADILGGHVKDGVAAHMAGFGAGERVLATGMEHLAMAFKDRKPYGFSLLSDGR